MTTLNDLDAIGGGSAKPWVSGETVPKWEYRKSQLDGEVYQRDAATGSGTTDPSDDVTNYVASSYQRVSALPGVDAAGVSNGSSGSGGFFNGATKAAINGIAAGTRTKILSLTGRGVVDFLGVYKNGTDNGVVEIILDGRTLLNVTTTNSTGVFGHRLIGTTTADGNAGIPLYTALPQPNLIQFRRSFDVWYTPVTSGTGANSIIGYITRATR